MAGADPPVRNGIGLEAHRANRRMFLLFIGRGRVQEVSRAFDGLTRFVREDLLPQDLVSVAAFNRATDFTSDHSSVIQLLTSLREHHASIESGLRQYFGVAEILYGSLEIPAYIQGEIDRAFSAPGAPAPRSLTPYEATPGGVAGNYARLRQDADPASRGDLANAKEAYDDLVILFAVLEYLKHLEGEKHVVHVTEQGMVGLRASEDSNSLASLAADARVAIHTIQAGGVPLRFDARGVLHSRSTAQMWAYNDGRAVSERTGGLASFYRLASDALAGIDLATRSRYLLAYEPADDRWDGGYRRIEVNVRRPDVTVLHRGGYIARQQLAPYDRREFLTSARIASAAAAQDVVKGIPIDVKPSVDNRKAGRVLLSARLRIPREALRFKTEDGRTTAEFVVASFVADRERRPIADQRRVVNVELAEGDAAKSPIEVVLAHDLAADPVYVKVVVYQYDGDRLGSAVARVR
jgi:VWFA-related protein